MFVQKFCKTSYIKYRVYIKCLLRKHNKKKSWTKIKQTKFIWLFNWYLKNYDDERNKETFIDQNKRK